MNNIFTYIYFICNFKDPILTIFMEYDNIVNVGAVRYKLQIIIAFESHTHKALHFIEIQFLISFDNLYRLDNFEITELCLSRVFGCIFIFDISKPIDSIID